MMTVAAYYDKAADDFRVAKSDVSSIDVPSVEEVL